MEARSLTLPHLPRRAPSFTAILTSGPSFTLLAALAAAGAAYELANGHSKLTLAACTLPLAVWLLTRRTIPLVMLGASIPVITSLTGNGQGGSGHNVSLSDLLLLLIGGGILMRVTITRTSPEVRALHPVALPVLLYGAFMIVLLPAHASVGEVLKTGQRFELFLLPLIVGAFAALANRHIRVLQAYVVAATVLAAIWPLHILDWQKNPVGQMIANAILLLVGVRALRRLFPCFLLLIPGLLLTQSRGAILAAIVGTIVILTMQGLNARSLATQVLPLVLIAAGAFVLLPSATQQRVTSFSSNTSSSGSYAVYYRQQYKSDAYRIIDAHPWTGVGVGNYLAGDPRQLTQARDPHQVILLQAAEGGYGLAACFVVLIAGSLFALVRLRYLDIAPAAAGVLVATVAHGFVDVYWVRGTPVLGWLLVGMVCGVAAKSRLSHPAEP